MGGEREAVAMNALTEAGREERPVLSVVIVTYNCRELVLECLESLDRQRGQVNFEVLLVDNESDDDTLGHVARRFPWVDAGSATGNVGFARANNIALRRARGEYVLLLNPDTVVPDGGLRDVLASLQARPEIGMIGCKLIRQDGTFDHACKRSFPTPLGALAYFVRLERIPWLGRALGPLAGQYTRASLGEDEAGIVDAINGAFMLARREAVDEVGLMDERFWMYGEDLDWCYRFASSGWPVFYWPGISVIHAKGGSSGKIRSWKTNRAFHHCMWLFYRKHQYREDRPLLNSFVWTGIRAKLLVSCARALTQRLRLALKQWFARQGLSASTR